MHLDELQSQTDPTDNFCVYYSIIYLFLKIGHWRLQMTLICVSDHPTLGG